MPATPPPKAVVCPTCAGHGYVFMLDIKGVNRQVACGHAVCQGAREERIATHVIAQCRRSLVDRAVHEVSQALPPDIKMRGGS